MVLTRFFPNENPSSQNESDFSGNRKFGFTENGYNTFNNRIKTSFLNCSNTGGRNVLKIFCQSPGFFKLLNRVVRFPDLRVSSMEIPTVIGSPTCFQTKSNKNFRRDSLCYPNDITGTSIHQLCFKQHLFPRQSVPTRGGTAQFFLTGRPGFFSPAAFPLFER